MDKNNITYLYKHLTPLIFTLKNEKNKKNIIVSAFIISVSDQWFLITAGHWFSEIRKLKEAKFSIISTRIIDYIGWDSKHIEPVSFVYDEEKLINLSEVYGLSYDYGVYPLSQYLRESLEFNNIEPLNEEVWLKQPTDFEEYWLVGIPHELISQEQNQINLIQGQFKLKD
ncbi:MAG: hypothetical protein CL609_23605 [Anaerolineaceae bacterium]|nr:hypothetical protein [Anaerolineaceae bacterium]